MDLKVIHSRLAFVAEKEEAGYFNPERYDTALDMASMLKFKRALPGFGLNEVISEMLTPFKRTLDITNATSPGGLISLPAEYQYITGFRKIGYDNVRNKTTNFNIQIVNDDELGDALVSQMAEVTVVEPIAKMLGTADGVRQIQLFPQVANACTIDYLARPNKPFFDYTTSDPDGLVVVYNQSTSVQMNWDESDIYDVIFGALKILGINLDDDKMAQYGMMMQQNP